MHMTRLPLIVTVSLSIMLCTWTAQAATNVEQVCAKKDFMEFIAAFAELSVRQQAACARFPLKLGGKTYTTQQAFQHSAKRKFIVSKQETENTGKPATPFFLPLPPDKNLSQFDLALKYVYLIVQDGDKYIATLTEGGTFPFETIEFLWNGEQWRLIEIRE